MNASIFAVFSLILELLNTMNQSSPMDGVQSATPSFALGFPTFAANRGSFCQKALAWLVSSKYCFTWSRSLLFRLAVEYLPPGPALLHPRVCRALPDRHKRYPLLNAQPPSFPGELWAIWPEACALRATFDIALSYLAFSWASANSSSPGAIMHLPAQIVNRLTKTPFPWSFA